MIPWEAVFWYLVAADCLYANVVAWREQKCYKKYFPVMSKWFPVTKAFGVWYLIMVAWVGCALYRLGIL